MSSDLFLDLADVFEADARHIHEESWEWNASWSIDEVHPMVVGAFLAHTHDEVTGTPRLIAIAAELRRRHRDIIL